MNSGPGTLNWDTMNIDCGTMNMNSGPGTMNVGLVHYERELWTKAL